MKVLTDYKDAMNCETKWTLYTGSEFKDFEPEDLPCALSYILRISKEAETVYITNFNMYFFDFIQVLWKTGFNPVKGNPTVKKMHENEFKYLVNGDMCVYNITIKHKKRAIVLINYDNIVNLNSRQKIIDAWTWPYEGENNHRYALAVYRSVKMLNRDCGVEARYPTTISGYARRKWKEIVGFWSVNDRLPDANNVRISGKENLEQYCRKAYHGGLNLCRGKALKNEIIDLPGYVLDINSLYPYIMANRPMPVKTPGVFEGKPTEREFRDARNGYTYIYMRVRVALRLKPDGIPCVQLSSSDKQCFMHKRGWLETTQYYNYHEQTYIEEEEPHTVELTLTMTDYWLMMQNYDVLKIEYVNYLVFLTGTDLFDDYVKEYYDKKKNAKNEGEKRIAKMMLNGLSGNMARLPEYTNLVLNIEETGKIKVSEEVIQGGASYVYIGAAITSYAREYLIYFAKQVQGQWLYSDTDSVHLVGNHIPKCFKIGDGIGEWKVEKEFDRAIYYKLKMYGFEKDGKTHLTLAGVPSDSVTLIERMIDENGEYDADGLEVYDVFDTMFDDPERDYKELSREKIMSLGEDIKVMGMKALMYSQFPVTIKKHDCIEFSETLALQFSSLDNTFLRK